MSVYAVMQKMTIFSQKPPFIVMKDMDGHLDYGIPAIVYNMLPDRSMMKSCCLKATIPCNSKSGGFEIMKSSHMLRSAEVKSMANEISKDLLDEDDEVCPVECVREFKTDDELLKIIEKAKGTNSLVVVDFYRTSCGSCKYIEQGFAKLCKGSGDKETAVIFLKHNVIDEYDEQSEVAERLRIKAVPLFHFYKDGVLLEAFPTRDKERILAAISKYATLDPQDL